MDKIQRSSGAPEAQGQLAAIGWKKLLVLTGAVVVVFVTLAVTRQLDFLDEWWPHIATLVGVGGVGIAVRQRTR